MIVQKDADSALERFNKTQVKLFLRPENEAVVFLKILNRSFSAYATQRTSFSYPHTPIKEYTRSRRDTEIEALERGANNASLVTSPTSTGRASAIQFAEVIDKYGPGHHQPK